MSGARIWAVVPAAGVGQRMQADRPKQYLPLLGKPILVHTVERLCNHPQVCGVVVCLSPEDRYWDQVRPSLPELRDAVIGGSQRMHSVFNGLKSLEADALAEDWVMVHDGVRPCLRDTDIDALISAIDDMSVVGAVLGLPITDTVKQTNGRGKVVETVPRESLWCAQTPQMFRLKALREALEQALVSGFKATDESAVMELVGKPPTMIVGNRDNIKITTRRDLRLAELYLKQQMDEG